MPDVSMVDVEDTLIGLLAPHVDEKSAAGFEGACGSGPSISSCPTSAILMNSPFFRLSMNEP